MNFYELLLNRGQPSGEGMTHFERLFAAKLAGGGGEIKELEGVPPLLFKANGEPLIDWIIYGNMSQTGTPTPTTPIQPQECGDLETEGAKAGQYKIPISSANTTTPVYLGEVQSTRRIMKLVLTGQERWYKSGAYQGSFYLGSVSPAPISLTEQAYCSHAEFTRISTYVKNKFCFNGSPINLNLWIGESSWTTDDFKAYLAQQYAAGTPVTVWYVLATETTGIVNEPLMKIGEYADTLSMEQAGVSIPTNNGSTTVDVETTLKPSEVYIKYKT